MKNSINLFFIVSLFFAISCKKKKENPNESNESINSPVVSQVPQKVDGYITVYYEYELFKDSSKLRQAGLNAMFYKQARNNDSIYYFPFDADVGNMTINDSAFLKETIGSVTKYYNYPSLASVAEKIKNKRVWNISGNESFQKMSVIDNTPLPEYLATVLPDTLYRKTDNIIKLGNYTGTAPIQLVIRFPNGFTHPKIPNRSAKEITFSPQDFLSFFEFETVNVTIQFNLINTSYQTVNGKVLCLTSNISYRTYEIPFKFGPL